MFDHVDWPPRAIILQFLAIGLGYPGLGYDVALIVSLLSNQRWYQDLDITPGSWTLGLVIASFVIGAVVASLPAAHLGDYIGRRWTVLLACIVNCLAILAQTFSVDRSMFIATRIMGGFATGTLLTNSTPYLNELVGDRYRAVAMSLAPTMFYVGSIPSAWGAFAALPIASSWSWRLVLVLQLIWSVLQLVLVPFCHESPRWLIMRGKASEARAVIEKMLASKAAPATDEQVDAYLAVLAENKRPQLESWTSFLRHENHKRLFLIILLSVAPQCVGTTIISFYLAPFLAMLGITDPRQQTALNGGLQIFNLLMAVSGALLSDRIGRRKLLLFSVTGSLLSMMTITICAAAYSYNSSKVAAGCAIAAIFFFFGSYDLGFTPIPPLYITEIVPTEMRARAAAISGVCSGSAIILQQWVNPRALASLQWRYLLVFDVILLLVAAAIFAYAPETKGLDLEGASKVCDPSTTD